MKDFSVIPHKKRKRKELGKLVTGYHFKNTLMLFRQFTFQEVVAGVFGYFI